MALSGTAVDVLRAENILRSLLHATKTCSPPHNYSPFSRNPVIAFESLIRGFYSMFHHVKELQFDARVSGFDPRFARLLLEQCGGGNGELKAAMQYFLQAFGCRHSHPDKFDLLMDIATEEFSHIRDCWCHYHDVIVRRERGNSKTRLNKRVLPR
jgi:hypothetical protein